MDYFNSLIPEVCNNVYINVDKLKCFCEHSSSKNIGNDFLIEAFPVGL